MCLVEIEPRLLIAGGSESFMGGLKSELLISGALARLSGRAPRCSNGASLTVGLVPRVTPDRLATHNYPTLLKLEL